ncbi:unnamed protein product [Colias eurytheme]|nr:unnamed protein product [Colias eurytheme]
MKELAVLGNVEDEALMEYVIDGIKDRRFKRKDLLIYKKYLTELKKGEIKPSVEKIAAVEHFQTPNNIKSLQSFLGLTGYFRKFIKDYSLIAKPLTDLLKKVLKIYDPNLETELHTDACAEGYGAVLLQRSLTDNKMHPVYYMSKKTSATEKKLLRLDYDIAEKGLTS